MTSTFKRVRLQKIAINKENTTDATSILIQDPLVINTGSLDTLCLKGGQCKFLGGTYNYLTASDLSCGIIRPEVDTSVYFTSQNNTECNLNVNGSIDVTSNINSPTVVCDTIAGLHDNIVKIPQLEVTNAKVDNVSVNTITSENNNVKFLKPILADSANISSLTSANISVEKITSEKGVVIIDKLDSNEINTSTLTAQNSKITNLNVDIATIGKIKAEKGPVVIDKLDAKEISNESLTSKNSVITKLNAPDIITTNIKSDKGSVNIDNLTSKEIKTTNINSQDSITVNLKATEVTVDKIKSENGPVNIDKLKSEEINSTNITSQDSKIINLTAENIVVGSLKPSKTGPILIKIVHSDEGTIDNLTSKKAQIDSLTSKDITVEKIQGKNNEAIQVPKISIDNLDNKKLISEDAIFKKFSVGDIITTPEGVTIKDNKKLKVNGKTVAYEEEIEETYRKLYLYENTFKASVKAPARVLLDKINFKTKQRIFRLFVISSDGKFIGSADFVIDDNRKVYKVNDSQSGSYEYDLTLENNNDIIIKPRESFNPQSIPNDTADSIRFFKDFAEKTNNNLARQVAYNTVDNLKKKNQDVSKFNKATYKDIYSEESERDKLVKRRKELEIELENVTDAVKRKEIQNEIRSIQEKIDAIDNAGNDSDGEDGGDGNNSGSGGSPIDENKTFELTVIIN